mmetsp:Transcript_7785/g.14675  ORF Transcript_7785/g.14675 Transcript_7785/m.14675 type:complete len:472 (-) Transcript_7785:3550-4965(-)|eukprot:CAMPEP_0176484442 /NCGR_PEP_ID=MMETSP0200_2-20121128/4456_1 /TAXON_ID=947934 /ORGANISM="Chaetoceros sp., Strain GSL56" /LENGTH=471 /DNA_ID=CAMNT_0017880915 /DNA_START=59 /DNA_END=1474 /DNA_ORIENTATION=+
MLTAAGTAALEKEKGGGGDEAGAAIPTIPHTPNKKPRKPTSSPSPSSPKHQRQQYPQRHDHDFTSENESRSFLNQVTQSLASFWNSFVSYSSSSSSSSSSPSVCTRCTTTWSRRRRKLPLFVQNPLVQKVFSLSASLFLLYLFSKLLNPQILHDFLHWMEHHPIRGLIAYLILYPLHMVLILPGTPLVMGAGFVFKVQYGWVLGTSFCTIITLLGSLLGSLICFYLGRHCFRTAVRRWSKKYPIFEPIDCAVSENGFQIMALIYLTPAVPLGPMSYMMGTTSMNVWDFAKAKIAALPMTALYVYLGAATGTLLMAEGKGNESGGGGEGGGDGEGGGVVGGGKESKKHMGELSLSPTMVVAGILLTVVIIVVISVKMKHELQRVLDQQTKRKEDIEPDDLVLLEKNNEQQQDVEMQEFISSSPNAIMSDGSGGTTGPLGQIQKRIVPKKKVVVGMETEQSTTATSSSTQQQS